MPEEQIIYLDPNDELTKVREKIKDIPARRIILVVPLQTQLRSNVGWRLLHAGSREMGKEIQVVSPDRQVRAVAKAAGFRVSVPQESSRPGKSRPPTRPSTHPTRNTLGNTLERRGAPRTRGPVSRAAPADGSSLRQREQLPPQEQDLPVQSAQNTWRQQENEPSLPAENIAGMGKETNYPPIEIVEDEYDQPFEFRVDENRAHSAHPLTARQDDEEQDPYIDDYRTAQEIREAAQGGQVIDSNPPVNAQEPNSVFPLPRSSTPPEPTQSFPFEEIEEFSPSSLPEQHGATFVEAGDDIVSPVADISNEAPEIEFLGDRDEFANLQDIPTEQWSDAAMNEPDEGPPPRTFGSRSGRSGKLPRRIDPNFSDPDFLLPVADQPTQTPVSVPRPSGSLAAGMRNRGAQPAPQNQPPVPVPARNVNPRIAPPPSRPVPAPRGARPAPPLSPATRRASRPPARRGGSRVATIVLVLLLLLVLVGIGTLYFGANATVTITLPSKSFGPRPIKLEATTNPLDKAHNTVASQVLTYNASVTGQGTATGSTRQGNAKATGTVNFTNNGQQQVTIPTGTLLTTTAGKGSVQFVTSAEAVIPPFDSAGSPVPVPVEAQSTGDAGNVAAGTVTVIPDNSITAIAQETGISASQINLSVTNPNPFSGGGAASVAAVTSGDLQALENVLHQQLQAQLKTWLSQQLHKGDIQGTPSPNVLASAKPLPQEKLIQVPGVGQPLTSKTFSGQLTARITILVVRVESLQASTQSQLNAEALAMKPQPYVLATQLPITLGKVSSTASKDGTTISISLSATGQIMQQVDKGDISANISGKTVDEAKSYINSGDAGPRTIVNITIEVSPSFLSIMPFRPEHIHVIVLPGGDSTKP